MKKRLSRIALFALGLAALPALGSFASAQSTEERIAALEAKVKGMEAGGRGTPLFASWDRGLNLRSADGKTGFKITGRLHNDWIWGDQADDLKDAGLVFEDGVRFRRARLGVTADVYENVQFRAEYDFAGANNAAFKDVFLALKGLPVLGTFRVGHFKEPFSLEELTSSNQITFMERSLPNVFAPGRNTGMAFNNTVAELNDKLGWAFGVFKQTDANSGDNTGGNAATKWAITARAYFLPLYEDRGKQMVHLGLAATRRATDGVGVRYRQRPENSLAPRLVDTGAIDDAENTLSLGFEAAAVYGPFSGQAEFMHTRVSSDAADDPSFNAFYLYGSWFLTGESRSYSASSGRFGRVSPATNFDLEGGSGAIELALRYSYLDLDDLSGSGTMWTATAGVNWHLNPNTRVMLNYIHANVDRGALDDSGNVLAMRFQWDF